MSCWAVSHLSFFSQVITFHFSKPLPLLYPSPTPRTDNAIPFYPSRAPFDRHQPPLTPHSLMPRDTASSAFVSSTCGVEDKPTGSTLDHSVFGPLYMGSRVLNRSLQTFLSHSLSLCKYIFYITRLSPLYDLQGFRQYISLQPDSIICNSRSLEAV